MGNGVCKTVFMTTGRDGRGMIMEQYSRSPMADPELKMELVMEVPTDTVRELLAQLGGLRRLRMTEGDSHGLRSRNDRKGGCTYEQNERGAAGADD